MPELDPAILEIAYFLAVILSPAAVAFCGALIAAAVVDLFLSIAQLFRDGL